ADPEARSDDLVALDEALNSLARHDAEAARLVNLRYFAGLSHQEAAEVLGLSRGAADRLLALARARLFRQPSQQRTAPNSLPRKRPRFLALRSEGSRIPTGSQP